MNEAVENKLYRYFDRFTFGVSGTYRDLEDVLGIDHVTIQRIVKESSDIIATVRGKGNSKETYFILAKYETINKLQKERISLICETKGNAKLKHKTDIFDKKKETKEIKFNTRQHKLCDYLLAKLKITNDYLDKVDVLWDLKEFYFSKSDDLPWKDDIKKSRHNYAEYVRLTNDISFVNLHGEIRQILIGSRGGSKGGVKALRLGEQYDAIDSIFGQGLKIFKKAWAMKKAAEKQAQTRMVFKNEKDIMDLLRQFDN